MKSGDGKLSTRGKKKNQRRQEQQNAHKKKNIGQKHHRRKWSEKNQMFEIASSYNKQDWEKKLVVKVEKRTLFHNL